MASALPVLGAAIAFYGPALRRTGGLWPAPLDDVYIHFAFARSAALGHLSTWIPGNGYSSGGTSLLYPLVLAPGWLIGFRGVWLGVFAALVACVALIDLCRSVQGLVDPGAGTREGAGGEALGPRPPSRARWVAWGVPLFVVAVPLLDWSWFSGMEVALLGAVLGRALLAVRRCEHAPPHVRPRAQWRAGLWVALLVATRPEMAVLSGALAVAVAHAAGTGSAVKALLRAGGPTGALLVGQAALNRTLTGEWSAAGAVRKLVPSNPYLSPLEVVGEVARNVMALRVQALESALGGATWAWILPALGAFAVLDRRSRRLALPLFLGGIGALILASFNATARFQNLRYAAPTLMMLLIAAVLGVAALARRGRPGGLVAVALAGPAVLAPSVWFGRQIDHFARSSGNIAEQQVEVARRLAAMTPAPRRVLLNDAGAIPYLSGLPAIDGLGLGGYQGMPFARASVHGVPAVVELIERLAPAERPDVMALYPGWWGGLVEPFGQRVDGVTIEDNVICGAAEKVIYAADWSALEDRGAGASEGQGELRSGEGSGELLDEIDVGDLISEKEHQYVIPAPRGGWVVGAVLDEMVAGGGVAVGGSADGGRPRKRFDAGRIVPEGREESFVIRAGVPRGSARLVLRTDGGGPLGLRVVVEKGERGRASGGAAEGEGAGRDGELKAEGSGREAEGSGREVEVPTRDEGRWHVVEVALGEVEGGDRIRIQAAQGAWRSFHGWLRR
ncbi:hypothetical protein [Chondromyces crocatus]|uniref:hypothetical protein n=1 Tax=Chondromyces crocatus TaxID=52 RepID=UPI001FE16300|nr:hypothetical protein [Chondromyces crocatus]